MIISQVSFIHKVIRVSLLAFFLSIVSLVHGANRLDSLLKVLDYTIEQKKSYSDQKESLLNALKSQLLYASEDEQKLTLYENVFLLYSNYQTDSAYYYANKRLDLANKLNNPAAIAGATMNVCEALRTSGMYKETLELLEGLRDRGYEKYNKAYFFHLYHSLYVLMADYAISDDDKVKYNSLIFSYKDSILHITDHNDVTYNLVSSTKKIMEGNYDEALQIIQNAYSSSPNNPMVSYTMSSIYKLKGNIEDQKIYLAESAIEDLRSGSKEYISLPELAVILFNEGDINRSYVYMEASMEDAIFSNARLRTLEISKMLPYINATHDLKMKQEQSRLYWTSFIAIILAVILFLTLIYLYRQIKALSAIRVYQKKMNVELKEMNEKLNKVNIELMDANLIKEEYIGYVFNMCSSYIDKLENFRVAVNRKIKTGLITDLEKMTSTSSLVADELKEFYKNFDTIFLNLYPSFVEELNELLPDEGKMIPKEKELLTPEMRIMALMRLGITDSVKIADFLHYSPQTIYNYRLKIRNKFSIPKEDIFMSLSKIGLK